MSGSRNSCQEGELGVVKEGAYADLLVVNGNPLENIDLVADPDENFAAILKRAQHAQTCSQVACVQLAGKKADGVGGDESLACARRRGEFFLC